MHEKTEEFGSIRVSWGTSVKHRKFDNWGRLKPGSNTRKVVKNWNMR
jgi:hypothetical protein